MHTRVGDVIDVRSDSDEKDQRAFNSAFSALAWFLDGDFYNC